MAGKALTAKENEMSNEANIKRLAEIQQQIKDLTAEAVKLAEQEQVRLEWWDMPFAAAYGAGGMRYIPEGMEDSGYSYDEGWLSSGSDHC